MTQAGQYPTFDDLHRHFDLGFVFGFVGSCRYHRKLIMLSELLVTGIEIGIIATGPGHGTFQIVGVTMAVVPPKYWKARTWLLNQSGNDWLSVASA